MDWIHQAQANSRDALLDAAAFVPTNRLDLSYWHPDFVDISFEFGFKRIESFGIDPIHTRVACLTGWLIDQPLTLHHSNGNLLIRLYRPADTRPRGGTVKLNYCDLAGGMFDYHIVERMANERRIHYAPVVMVTRERAKWPSDLLKLTWPLVFRIRTA